MQTLSEAVYKTIFPPEGAIPLKAKRNIQAIDARIKEIEELATGKAIEGMTRRIGSKYESQRLTEQIVQLRDSCSPPMSYREIMKRLGHVITPDAARNRYDDYKQKLLKAEAYAAMSGESPQKTDMPDQLVGPDEMILIELKPREKAEPGEDLAPTIRNCRIVQENETDISAAAPPALLEAKPEQCGEATVRDSRIVEKVAEVPPEPEPETPTVQANQGPENAENPQKTAPDLPEKPSQDQAATVREFQIVEKNEQVKRAHDLTPSEAGKINGPRIPHTEDQWILDEKANGKTFREIREALQAGGISCTMNDVMSRFYDARRKHDREVGGKKPANEPTSHEQGQLTRQEGDKPAPKSISRADLNIRIWDAYQAGDSIEKISADLNSEGYYYNERQVRNRLKQQGANL